MTDAVSKLHPALREAVITATSAQRAQRVYVLVKLAPGEGSAARLADVGFLHGATFGDIVTGSIELGGVERLAASDDVVYVEASRPLPFDAAGES